MTDAKIDRETMAKLAKALAFICGPDNATTQAMKKAAESGTATDIKKAHGLFLKLNAGHRQAALSTLTDHS